MPKISDLPAAGTATGPELIPIVQNGVTKSIVFSDFYGSVADEAAAQIEPLIAEVEASADAAAAAAADADESADAAAVSRARAYADRLRSEHILDSLQDTASETYVELLAGRDSGLSLDFTREDLNLAVNIVDLVTPANNTVGPLSSLLNTTTSFPTPRYCKQEDGTYKFNPHNDILQSNDFTNASWTKANLTTAKNQNGPTGVANDACLLTTSSVIAHARQSVTSRAGVYRHYGVKVKQGTAAYCYVTITDNAVAYTAYFNMATLAFGTVDANLVAEVSAFDEDGTALDTGWRYLSFYKKNVATATEFRLGLCDANGSTAVTSGVTLIAADVEHYGGLKRLPYMETTTAAVRDAPIDWTPGVGSLMLNVSTVLASRSGDDWSNATYWTATNVTPTYPDSVGPHGEPCSSFTATSTNGTIKQAVTASGTAHNVYVFLKRKTGTGTIEWSIDNGSTYTDITSEVDAATANGEFYQAWMRGAVANPTVIFRVGTSGDAFYGSMFCSVKRETVQHPMVAGTVDFTTSQDTFSIPTTEFELGTTNSVYADIHIHESCDGAPGNIGNRLGFAGAGSVESSIQLGSLTVDGGIVRIQHLSNDGTSRSINLGRITTDGPGDYGRIQTQLHVGTNNHAISYNGNAVYWNSLPGAQTFTSYRMTMGAQMWLRRLVIEPRTISFDYDEFRLWHLDTSDANVNRNLLASAFVAKVVPSSTGILRSPGLLTLYEEKDTSYFVTFWGERNTTGYTLESPQRVWYRKWSFDRSTNELLPLTDAILFYQDSGWASGTKGANSDTHIKITEGPYRGRILSLLAKNDGTDNTDLATNIYMMYSDDNADTWSTPVKVFDKTEFVGSVPGFVIQGNNSTIFQLKDGPHAGRVYFSLNGGNENFYAAWTDEFKEGASITGTQPGIGRAAWSISATPIDSDTPFGSLSEPAITYWPNDNIVMLCRNSSSGIMAYSVSTDYGLTFPPAQQISGDTDSASVNCGLIQDDPTGGKGGRRGRLVIARSTVSPRTGHKIQSSFDDVITLDADDNYILFGKYRFVGYCPLKKAFENDNIYIMMAEVQPNTISNIDTSQMVTVFRY